jgi:hypothetical protein
MSPSEEFPGREGTLVHPNLLSFMFLPKKDEKTRFKTGYTESDCNRSLCFECIESTLPKSKKKNLLAVYNVYQAEINFNEKEEAYNQRFTGKLVNINNHLALEKDELYENFRKLRKELQEGCLFCNKNVENGNPFFVARVIDKVYSKQHLSGLSFIGTNYSWSNIRTGHTDFRICFEDFEKKFPSTFEQLSYDLIGERNPNFKPEHTLYLDPSIEIAAIKEGLNLDDWVKKLKEETGDGIKIIIPLLG